MRKKNTLTHNLIGRAQCTCATAETYDKMEKDFVSYFFYFKIKWLKFTELYCAYALFLFYCCYMLWLRKVICDLFMCCKSWNCCAPNRLRPDYVSVSLFFSNLFLFCFYFSCFCHIFFHVRGYSVCFDFKWLLHTPYLRTAHKWIRFPFQHSKRPNRMKLLQPGRCWMQNIEINVPAVVVVVMEMVILATTCSSSSRGEYTMRVRWTTLEDNYSLERCRLTIYNLIYK